MYRCPWSGSKRRKTTHKERSDALVEAAVNRPSGTQQLPEAARIRIGQLCVSCPTGVLVVLGDAFCTGGVTADARPLSSSDGPEDKSPGVACPEYDLLQTTGPRVVPVSKMYEIQQRGERVRCNLIIVYGARVYACNDLQSVLRCIQVYPKKNATRVLMLTHEKSVQGYIASSVERQLLSRPRVPATYMNLVGRQRECANFVAQTSKNPKDPSDLPKAKAFEQCI